MRLPSATLLRTQSDGRLVALAREGWEPAFTALVERYRREILRACMRVLPEARAEDATQQVFMAAWNALRRGDEVREVRPWLHTIARNIALNALRVPGYDHGELAESLRATEAPQAELERREVMRATLAGLAALPERQREALLRSAVEGASHAEIAAGLGIKEGAARQLVLRARTTLRAAATALTPMPLLTWSLSDTVAGSGAAGATGVLAKAGVVALVAGGAVATPVVVHDRHDGGPAAAQAATRAPAVRHATKRAVATAAATTTATPVGTTAAALTATATRRPVVTATPAARVAPVRTAEAEHDNRGPGPGSASGPGSGRRDEDTVVATPVPTVTAEPTETSNSSGPGSPGSGSGSGSTGGPGPDSDAHDGSGDADHHGA